MKKIEAQGTLHSTLYIAQPLTLFLLRMGFLEAAVTLGTLMGTFLSSYVFNFVGYVGVFGSCSAIVAFVAVYTYFLIPESVTVKKTDVSILLHLNK